MTTINKGISCLELPGGRAETAGSMELSLKRVIRDERGNVTRLLYEKGPDPKGPDPSGLHLVTIDFDLRSQRFQWRFQRSGPYPGFRTALSDPLDPTRPSFIDPGFRFKPSDGDIAYDVARVGVGLAVLDPDSGRFELVRDHGAIAVYNPPKRIRVDLFQPVCEPNEYIFK